MEKSLSGQLGRKVTISHHGKKGRVQLEYDALRSEVESTVSHAADQLEKAGKCLEQVNALLADQDVALEELSRAYDSTDREKVPAPMPLTEL